MPQQPDLIAPPDSPSPESNPVADSQASASQSAAQAPARIPPWLVRVELYLRVLVRMYIGISVCFVPWVSVFWDQNPLFIQFPNLAVYAANGAVRGLISGLGLLNLWIALQDAMHHRGR